MVKVLLAQTSANMMGDHPTGGWSEELTAPWYVFKDAGYEVTIATVKGGDVVLDVASLSDGMRTEWDDKFHADHSDLLKNCPSFGDINVSEYDAVFFSGGHGTCVDFPQGAKKLVEDFWNAGKVVSAVCHGPTALLEAEVDGQPLLKGKKCTGFSDAEEEAVGLTAKVPGLLSTLMKNVGGNYECSDQIFTPYVCVDGKLVTGQNPGSSKPTSEAVVKILSEGEKKQEISEAGDIKEVKKGGCCVVF